MPNDPTMKRLCDFYIRWVATIGALYCIVPTLIWFAVLFLSVPFRSVYVLRLILAVGIGGPLAGFSNRAGLRFWLIKHGSSDGPATVLDGILIGAACGMGTVLVPPLTSLIASHHLQQARSLIIVLWLVGMAVGCLIGGTLAAIGRRHIRGGKPVKGE